MLTRKDSLCSSIIYRPIKPSDLDVLEQIHTALFPIRYEREFFLNVVNGHGIVSWAAVDVGTPDNQSDELIGFVTTRVISAEESEIGDLLKYATARNDTVLVYILTLGVVQHFRKLGIATSLVRQVIKYASSMANCRAVYLHVISYNQPAIQFYEKMQFKLVRRLSHFYYIHGQHYDSYLFAYYVNGGQSPCSPLELAASIAAKIRGLLKSVAMKFWKNDERKRRWSKCKETTGLLLSQNKRIISAEHGVCQCV